MLWVHLKTIFSFRVYHLLTFTSRKQRVWFAVYLFLLALLVFYLVAGAYIDKRLPVFLKNFPQITIEKGVLTAPKEPVFASLPGTDFRLAFDSNRQQPPSVNEMIETNTLVLLNGNTLYMPGAAGMQVRQLSPTLNLVTSQEFLQKNKPIISLMLRLMAFTTALFFIPLIFLFDFCIAGTVGFFFNLLRLRRVERARILTWAFFLLGPLTALWFVRLWINIPLFTFAQVILCIIYMQQIFNTLPEGK